MTLKIFAIDVLEEVGQSLSSFSKEDQSTAEVNEVRVWANFRKIKEEQIRIPTNTNNAHTRFYKNGKMAEVISNPKCPSKTLRIFRLTIALCYQNKRFLPH